MKSLLAVAAVLLAFVLAGTEELPPEEFELTSGALRRAGEDSGSRIFGSDSEVFRLRSKSSGFRDVEVSLELLDKGLASGLLTTRNAWDGVHVWLRYQSPTHLYAVSVNRRDDRVVIKKKAPGGPSYGGTYFDLCDTVVHRVPYGVWQRVEASAVNLADGRVRLTLTVDGKKIAEAVDDGSSGGPPIRQPGRVGLRGDNADFEFRRFAVRQVMRK